MLHKTGSRAVEAEGLEHASTELNHARRSSSCLKHDLFGKPVPTFPDHALTIQQWAVLGALSRNSVQGGMSIGDLARYLMVSRQNLAGLLSRMERDGHILVAADTNDRRSRIVSMTDSGRHVWQALAQPKIHDRRVRPIAGR